MTQISEPVATVIHDIVTLFSDISTLLSELADMLTENDYEIPDLDDE